MLWKHTGSACGLLRYCIFHKWCRGASSYTTKLTSLKRITLLKNFFIFQKEALYVPWGNVCGGKWYCLLNEPVQVLPGERPGPGSCDSSPHAHLLIASSLPCINEWLCWFFCYESTFFFSFKACLKRLAHSWFYIRFGDYITKVLRLPEDDLHEQLFMPTVPRKQPPKVYSEQYLTNSFHKQDCDISKVVFN